MELSRTGISLHGCADERRPVARRGRSDPQSARSSASIASVSLRTRPLFFAVLVTLAPSIPRTSGACKPYPANYGPHKLDPAFADDTMPPTMSVVSADVWDSIYSGGGCDGGGCGHPNLVHVAVDATDDRASPDRIGYKLAITRGEAPRGFTLPDTALRAMTYLDGHGELGLVFDDDAPSGWSFDLQITAVDLNGNESAPVTVTLEG
jgi:hypothetical protein